MIKEYKPEWQLGKITKIEENTLIADIEVFGDESLKDCKFIGTHTSEVKVGDNVLVLLLSRELFLYTLLKVDSFLGLKQGNSVIDLTKQGTITIKADSVIIDSDSIKIGGSDASYIPLTVQDIPSIQYINAAGTPTPVTLVDPTGAVSKKVKIN